MLRYTATCVLCGDQLRDSGPEWMRRFRAVFSWRNSFSAQISGPGIRVAFGDVMEVERGPTSDTNSNLARVFLMRTKFVDPDRSIPGVITAWGFPFHASCWAIFRQIRAGCDVDAQALLDILRSFPAQCNMLNFGHDYGGNVEYEKSEVPLLSREEHRQFTNLGRIDNKSDPLDIPELRSLFDQMSNQARCENGVVYDICPVDPTTDPFSRIPEELLLAIFEDMSIPEVFRLKRASKRCANIVLPQSFWKHRVIQSEFGHVFEARQHAESLDGQWESLYHHLRGLKGDPVMANRERIWKLGHSLWNLLDAKRTLSPLSHAGDADSFSWVTASRCLTPMDRDFTEGSRALFFSRLSVPRAKVHVFISTVEIHEKRYVSGLRVVLEDGRSESLGYQNPACEVRVSEELMEAVGFHLALGEGGIRGIATILMNGSLSKWVGDHEGVPKRRLVLDSTDASVGIIRYLKAGVDALKLVSLSISDGSDDSTSLESQLSLRDREIWLPDIPGLHLAALGMDRPQHRNRRPSTPITLSLFGSNTETPPQVRRLAVQTDRDGKLLSVEVTRGGEERCVRLGLNRAKNTRDWILDFDHAAGEEIIGLEVFYHASRWQVGYKIHTSAGRALSVLSASNDGRNDVSAERYFPAIGRVVGFCARVSRWVGLVDIGLVYDDRPENGEQK